MTTNHVALALSRLPEQFKSKTNVRAFLEAMVESKQSIEDAIVQLLTMRFLTTATGVTLEAIGNLVGQSRDGADDDIYRRYIRTRIKTNRSNGTIPDIITISRLVLDDAGLSLLVSRSGIATIVILVGAEAVSADLADTLISFLRQAAVAGVRLILESSTVAPVDTFTLDTALTSQALDNGSLSDARE